MGDVTHRIGDVTCLHSAHIPQNATQAVFLHAKIIPVINLFFSVIIYSPSHIFYAASRFFQAKVLKGRNISNAGWRTQGHHLALSRKETFSLEGCTSIMVGVENESVIGRRSALQAECSCAVYRQVSDWRPPPGVIEFQPCQAVGGFMGCVGVLLRHCLQPCQAVGGSLGCVGVIWR